MRYARSVAILEKEHKCRWIKINYTNGTIHGVSSYWPYLEVSDDFIKGMPNTLRQYLRMSQKITEVCRECYNVR